MFKWHLWQHSSLLNELELKGYVKKIDEPILGWGGSFLSVPTDWGRYRLGAKLGGWGKITK